MSDVFISHAEEDAGVALELARGLQEAGYSTWSYEEDGAPGQSYLLQIDEEIERCQAVVVVISPDSLGSDQVSKEVVRAHEAAKPFIPIRSGISHVEFQQRRREWRMALGAAVSLDVPPEGASAILPRILKGLQKLGVRPSGPGEAAPVPPVRRGEPPPDRPAPAVPPPAKRPPIGVVVAALVGGAGVVLCLWNLFSLFSPKAGSPEAWIFTTFSGFRVMTILTNLVLVGANGLLLRGAALAHQQDPRGAPLLRRVSLGIVIFVAAWTVLALLFFVTGAGWNVLDSAGRSGLVGGTIRTGVFGLIPAAVVYLLFRRTEAIGPRR
jgi:hypothetical protein